MTFKNKEQTSNELESYQKFEIWKLFIQFDE